MLLIWNHYFIGIQKGTSFIYVFQPVESKSDVKFCRQCLENPDNLENIFPDYGGGGGVWCRQTKMNTGFGFCR